MLEETLLPFMVHVEELAYQLIDRMFCLDFDVDGKEECQKEQNTTGDGDQLRNRQFTSMIIGSSVWNSVLQAKKMVLHFDIYFIFHLYSLERRDQYGVVGSQ